MNLKYIKNNTLSNCDNFDFSFGTIVGMSNEDNLRGSIVI